MHDKNRDSFELRALQRVAQSGERALDLDVVLDRCLEHAISVAGSNAGVIYLRDQRRGVVRKAVQRNAPDEMTPLTIPAHIVDQYIVEPYQLFDLDEQLRSISKVASAAYARGIRRTAVLRFVVDERRVGFLALLFTEPRELAESTRETLVAMAAFEAVAIQAARVHLELYDRARVANLLRDFGERALDPDADVPALVLETTRSVAGVDRALIGRVYERAPGERWIKVEHSVGDHAERIVGSDTPAMPPQYTSLLTQPLVVEDMTQVPADDPNVRLAVETGIQSFVAVAMRYGGKPFGMLAAASSVPHQFSDAEVEGMELFSTMAAAALERARRQKEERAQHAQLAAVIEHLPIVVYVIDRSGEILHLNAAARAFGAVIGTETRHWPDAFKQVQVVDRDGNPIPPEQRGLMQAFAGKVPEPRELQVVTDTQRLTVLSVAAPLPNADGTIDHVVCAVQDVSQLRALSDAKDRFLSIASHELRSPITSLRATTSLLQLDPSALVDEARRTTLFQRIQRQIDRLATLVDRLLDTARLNADQLPLDYTECELGALCQEAIDVVKPSLRDHTIVLEQPAPLYGRWDPARVEQVVTNLLSNAVRYSPPSEIRVRVYQEGERARVDVIDRGVGIAANELPNVFTPFFRGQHAAAQHKSGLGLGLYITHEIVRRHGGELKVTSAPGQGSTFTVVLPLGPT